jgi:biopolymer transport protein ExbD
MAFTQREARGLIRKAVGRVPEGESIRHLNIMPMMDMMTILLVAFIFQMATSSTELNAGLVSLPKSLSSDELPEGAATVIITPSGIVVEGKSILAVRPDGDVDPGEKEGGTFGVAIPRLTNFLAALHHEEVARRAAAGDTSNPVPELLVIADRTTRYGLLLEVMVSAKEQIAGYKRFRLIVQKQYPIKAEPPE